MKRKLVKAINLFCFLIYNRIIGKFLKVDENKMVFLSEASQELTGNLKCMHDYFDSEKYRKKVHMKLDRRSNHKLRDTLEIWKDLTTGKYVFLDDFYSSMSAVKVRKGQEIIQLWHGAGAYKKFGFSRKNTGDSIKKVHSGYRKYTKSIVSAENIRWCFSEAFGIDKSKVYATGIPRTDELLKEDIKDEKRKKFYEKHPELRGKKIVLFAPTYRGSKVEDASYDFNGANLDLLTEELGDEYAVLTRWHTALRNNINRGNVKEELTDKAHDFSSYKEINDLLIVADVLITDYSSIIFDYFLLKKPIVLFTPDREEYEESRGLYFNFEEYVYGAIVENREALKQAIVDEGLNEERRESFNEKFMKACTGNCTEKVSDLILKG